MMNILMAIAVIYLIYSAFQTHIALGIAAVLILVLYYYFKGYASFCMNQGRLQYAKNPEKALKWMERGYKKGLNIGHLESYAYYLMREGQPEKSEKIYKQLLAENLKPDLRMKIQADIAVLYMKTGRVDEALEEMEEVSLNFNNTTTYGTLGYLYLVKNNRKKAFLCNKEAYDYNSDDPIILDNMVQLYIKDGRYREAKQYADMLVAKKPYFIEGYYDSAFVYLKLGEIEKAKEIFEQGKDCRITFMSTVTSEDMEIFRKALDEGNTEISHKLGLFSDAPQEEPEEKTKKSLPMYEEYDEEDYAVEYEEGEEEDENDPFI